MTPDIEKKILIAGPCSAKSEVQTVAAAVMVVAITKAFCRDDLDIFVRSPMTKEPTMPSKWIGPGEKGLIWLINACNDLGVNPATEITDTKDARAVARQCNKLGVHSFFAWFGSKANTSHELAEQSVIIKDIPNIQIGVKNPPQEDSREWEGRVSWIMDAGIPKEKIHLIDRGFAPQGRDNPLGHRNLLNFQISQNLREKLQLGETGLDASHSGGSPNNTLAILKKDPLGNRRSLWVLEACPTLTLTDDTQRLDCERFIEAMKIISQSIKP